MASDQLITQHLELWTAAMKRRSSAGRGSTSKIELYGIKKLRELILELAVRGLLMPQDPSDEPANELLKKIATEKARLAKEGKITKEKRLSPITAHGPASVPEGWVTSRFGELVAISTGKLDANAAVENGEYPFFTCSQTPSRIDRFAFDTAAVLLAGNGDFNIKYYRGKFEAYQRTYVIEPICWDLKFCFILVSSQIGEITKNNRGSAVKYLKLGDLTDPVFLLPPLPEQRRIVAKVDELMNLCDQMEQETYVSLGGHQTLVETMLGALANSGSHEQFSGAWQRVAAHFDNLITTEGSIEQLKQVILRLAVMGKLVPQDPTDEPASELLKKIATEKEKLVYEGKIKKEKPLPEIGDEERLFPLPKGWTFSYLSQLAYVFSGNAFKSEDFNETAGVRAIKITNAGVGEIIETNDFLPEHFLDEYQQFQVHEGDLILALTRPYISDGLKISVCPSLYHNSLLNQRVAVIRSHADKSFLYLFLQSGFVLALYKKIFGGSGLQPNLKMSDVTDLVIPVPPIEEQHRIVSKVGELMAVCNQLKAQLNEAQTTQVHLADAITEQALVG